MGWQKASLGKTEPATWNCLKNGNWTTMTNLKAFFFHLPASLCANTMAKCYNGSIMTILCLWYTIWQICHIYNIKAYFPLFTCLVLIWLIVLSPSAQHSWCLFLQMKRGNPVNSLHMFLGWVNAVLLLYGALISCRVKNWCRGVVY